MAITAKEIKEEEIQEDFDYYWEFFRKNIPLANDPSVVEYTKSVFKAGFFAGSSNTLRKTIEAIQQPKSS